jgi:hypothetical protein
MEMTQEEIEETDRKNIRLVFERTGVSPSEDEIENTRLAMLKAIALKQIAANALVEDDAENQETLIAIYTSALCSLLK